jgi:hypothetical protein
MGPQNVGKEIYPMIGLNKWTCYIYSPKKGWNLLDRPRLQASQQIHQEGHHTTPQYSGHCRKPWQ